MKILLDECVPRKFKRELPGDVSTVSQRGWASITNGRLIALAETEFDVFITVDKGIQHQQRLASASLGFIVLRARSNRLPDLLPLVPQVLQVLTTINAGDVVQVPLSLIL